MPIRVSFLPRVLVLFCVFSFFSFHLSAQTPDTAVVRGSVVDQSHAVVAGADITISNQHTGLKRTAQTDASGKFSVSGLPIGGEYEISAQKQGFALATSNVTVIGGATAEMNFQLSPAAEKTEILVTGAVGEVRTDLPQIGHVADRGDAAPESPHHLSANAQRGQSPGHQPGRRLHEPESVYHQRHRTPPRRLQRSCDS